MTSLQALLLGILQGLTEFLPVSSSGHLVIIPWLCDWSAPSLVYDVGVHLATTLAVIAYFWADVRALVVAAWDSVRHRRLASHEARLGLWICCSAIPGAVAGFLLEDWFESLFATPVAAACLLVVTGILLLTAEALSARAAQHADAKPLEQMSLMDALLIGLAQAAAIAPGISRSGSTISAGLLRGFTREAASRFAFLMSLPIILGAAAYQVLKALSAGVVDVSMGHLALGMLGAGISGYFAIRFLMKFVQSHKLTVFAVYVFALAALALGVAWL